MENIRIYKEVRDAIENLLLISEGYATSKTSIHIIEKGILKQLLALGLSLLSYIIQARIREVNVQNKLKEGLKRLRFKGNENCQYLSLFGLLEITRPSYWSKETGKVHPSDSDLSLPLSSHWSYNIEELVGENAAECDYKESVRVINKLLNLGLSGKSSERNIGNIGILVDSYYDSKIVEKQDSAVCFSASFDGKGVPKIKDVLEKSTEVNPKKRLGKGEKKGIMEMATVNVTSWFVPKKRSIESILNGLMGSQTTDKSSQKTSLKESDNYDNNWHKEIHRRAFLGNQNKSIEYGLNRIKDKMNNPKSRFVVPIDAGIGLEDKVLTWVKKNNMEAQFDGIILDIIHVTEYVWDAATALFGEKSQNKSTWVRDALKDLLNSKTSKVIKNLSQVKKIKGLSESKQAQVEKTIVYFTNHQHKMDYKTFIEKGYPISSALVESACGHLVKERMEQSGMRWSSQGAQNMMDMRAIKLNNDMEDFMDFRIKAEQLKSFKLAA